MKILDYRLYLLAALLLIGAIALVGCTGLESIQPTPTGEAPAGEQELNQEEIIALIVADLASRKMVDPEEIGAASVEKKTWNDASLGCPQEGMGYAQTLTPGFRILLAIGGPAEIEQFDYRTDMRGNFILCE